MKRGKSCGSCALARLAAETRPTTGSAGSARRASGTLAVAAPRNPRKSRRNIRSPPVQHDVENRELGLRLELLRGRKQLDGETALSGSGKALQEPILVVLGLAREIHLRDQHIGVAPHIEVNMRRADESRRGRIGARLDGLEMIASLGVGRE